MTYYRDLRRKKSITSIASTNPGDGTKRLYGEESYIHDDIQDPPIGPCVRPRVVAPVTPTRPKKVKEARVSREVQLSGESDEKMVFLSDSAPRG